MVRERADEDVVAVVSFITVAVDFRRARAAEYKRFCHVHVRRRRSDGESTDALSPYRLQMFSSVRMPILCCERASFDSD